MLRRLFTLLSALSLLLCVATALLSWHSYRTKSWPPGVGDRPNYVRLYHRPGVSAVFASVAEGKMWLVRQHVHTGKPPAGGEVDLGTLGTVTLANYSGGRHHQGFSWWGGDDGLVWMQHRILRQPKMQWAGPLPAVAVQSLRVSLGTLVVVFLIPPAVWAVRCWAARRRRPDGHCRSCGYDLRATPGRCPECGTAAAGKAV